MKITHNKVGQNLNLTDASRTDKSKKSEGAKASSAADAPDKTDGLPFASNTDSAKVDLSARAKDIARAKEIAMASPDMDQAKIEKFQKLIDDGKYKVDSKAIAERMVEEHMMTGKTSEE
ncbi:flagellar biosynthesis anti-sigma factor FlgM [Bdellovibrio sp. qaytius]|nr:flagellar biosynthesis anti-sigma factor FlgM [Bdellovibrio sp. qaytius]